VSCRKLASVALFTEIPYCAEFDEEPAEFDNVAAKADNMPGS